MKLYELFNIDLEAKELICFVGAGGKTTTMFILAEILKDLNKKVLVTTSTAIYKPSKDTYDRIIIEGSNAVIKEFKDINNGSITVAGREISDENKLLGLSKTVIEEIYNKKIFDFILVEADGSKRKPIKAPADHEPVIPQNTDKVIGLVGIDAIGKRINEENVHRPKLFCEVTESKMGEVIDEKKIYSLIKNDRGLFKEAPLRSKKYVLLNKVDNKNRVEKAIKIIELIEMNKLKINAVIASNIIEEKVLFSYKSYL